MPIAKINRDSKGRCLCPSPLPERLTPCEVAAYFGVTARTVQEWARAGKIVAVKTLGGHRRFTREEVVRFDKVRAREAAFR